jgi:hypothetical protein
MQQQALGEQIAFLLDPPLKRFKRSCRRSRGLSLMLLTLAHLFGSALMLSPLIGFAATSAIGIYLLTHLAGPLDLFLIAVLAGISVFCAYLCTEMYRARPDAAGGITLVKSQAPLLFAMVERDVSHFKIKPIERIVLTPGADLNIQARPRLPIPIFHEYTLCIGAPTLYFLSPAQFRLALAGAIAASQHTQSSVAGWAAQAAQDWGLIVKSLKSQSSLYAKMLLSPVARIAKFSGQLSVELHAHWQQIQSRWVLEHTDEHNAIQYLANHVIARSFLSQQYWPMIFKAAERCPAPVVKPFCHFELILERTLNRESASRWLLQAQVNRDFRQAGLRDVLADLGIDHLRWSRLPEHNAFHNIFKSHTVLKKLDDYWRGAVAREWDQRYTGFRREKLRFEKLQERARHQNLRGESALHYIRLAARFLDKQQSAAVYLRMYQGNLDNADVCYAAGQKLLGCGYAHEAYEALQRAAELDRSLTVRAQALINEHKHAWLTQGHEGARAALTA